MKRILPSIEIGDEFYNFAKGVSDGQPFPCFNMTEMFFQYYFNTNLKLNDSKNMTSYVKENFELVDIVNGVKYYKVSDAKVS